MILDRVGIQKAMVRIAHEILERNTTPKDLALVGIQTGGVFLARRLAREIAGIAKEDIPVGAVDITLYRDDLAGRSTQPMVKKTEIPFSITGKHVVIVDDVLYTGRTLRAAMDCLLDFGRPAAIQFAVLIDRGHRELPIRADYVGKNLPTSARETISVLLEEEGEEDRVVIRGES